MFKRKKATRKQDNLDLKSQPLLTETLGQFIRRLRLIRGIKLSDLSRATARFGAQVSEIYLSHLELDMVPNRAIEDLTKIAKALDIPPQWLIEKSEMSEMAVKHGAQDDLREGARQVTLDPNEEKMILAMIEVVLHRRKSEKSQKQE